MATLVVHNKRRFLSNGEALLRETMPAVLGCKEDSYGDKKEPESIRLENSFQEISRRKESGERH